MLRISRTGWAVVLLVTFLVVVNLVLLFAVFWIASLDRQGMYRDVIRADLGTAITKPKSSETPPEDKKSENRFISAEISTVGSSVWLNGQRFELGSFVAPYGVIAEVGANVAVVVDLDGVSRIIARPVPPCPAVPSGKAVPVPKETGVKKATAATGAPAPVAGA